MGSEGPLNPFQDGAGLFQGDALGKAGHRPHVPGLSTGPGCAYLQGEIDVGPPGELESPRHHAHHGMGLALEAHHPSHDVRIACEPPLPEVPGGEGHPGSPRKVLLRREGPAKSRLDPQGLEETSGHAHTR